MAENSFNSVERVIESVPFLYRTFLASCESCDTVICLVGILKLPLNESKLHSVHHHRLQIGLPVDTSNLKV